MKIDFRVLAALPLIAAASIASPAATQTAPAQDKSGTNLSDSDAKPTPASAATDTLMLGYRLADYARTTKDARAMIAAARIVDTVTVKDSADKGKIEGADADKVPATEMKPVTAASLYDEAVALANGDQDLLAAIEAARAEASRGIIIHAVRMVQYVPRATTWTLRFAARGGEPLVVGARRDAATPVDMKIYDENGNLVCQDMSHNATLYCRVNPIWTGEFAAQLINHGTIGTTMAVVTN
ncbi:hypothetical protein [Sphingomonas sp. LT1P40]|uniref:hypothetical protein n=1 Tax=Alteristakelama amylovorans TaxID=3096166 RepID=UPI002FCC1C18